MTIYLVTSKLAIVVLCNQAIVLTIALATMLKGLFLGELRTNEVERVNETLRFTIPEVSASVEARPTQHHTIGSSVYGQLLRPSSGASLSLSLARRYLAVKVAAWYPPSAGQQCRCVCSLRRAFS